MTKKNYLIGSFIFAGILSVGLFNLFDSELSVSAYSKKNLNTIKKQEVNEALIWLRAWYVDRETGKPISQEKLAIINKQLSKLKTSKSISFEPQGPDNIGGRTRAIQIDRTNNNRLWAGGVSGGIFVSTNRGNLWERIDSYINAGASPFIASMTQTIDGVLYVATGSNDEPDEWSGNGVWYSTDFGQTWNKIPGTTNCTEVESSDIDNYVWLATTQGLKKWKLGDVALTSTSVSAGSCEALKVSKDGQVIVAAFGSNRTYVSNDGGVSFTNQSGIATQNKVPQGSPRIEYAISPTKNSTGSYTLYAVRTNDNLLGMHISNDDGKNWKQFVGASEPPNEFDIYGSQGTYNTILTVKYNDPSEILIGGIDVWKWKQAVDDPLNGPSGGFVKISQWFVDPSSPIYVHVDNHEMKWDALNRLYVGNDGGIGITNDAGKNWFPSNRGYNVTQFYGIAFDRDGAVMGGTQDNGTIYNDHTLSTFQEFRQVAGGDGFECEISHFNPSVMFVSLYYNSISRSGDRGKTWNSFTPDLPSLYPPPGSQGTAFHPFHTEFILAEHYDLNSKDSVTFVAKKNYKAGSVIRIASLSTGDTINIVTQKDLYFYDTLNYDPSLTVGNKYFGKNSATGEIVSMGSEKVIYNVSWDTLRIQDPFQSWFLVYVNANGGELWGTRNALRLSSADYKWVCIARGIGGPMSSASNVNSNIDVEFSRDLKHLYIVTNTGVWRRSGLDAIYSSEKDFKTKATFNASALPKTLFKISSTSYEGLAVNPNNPDDLLLLAGFNGTNRRTSNATSADDSVPLASLPMGSVSGVACYDGIIDASDSDRLVVGTANGVIVSEDGGATWQNASKGFEGTPVFEVRQQWRPFEEGGYRFGEIYIGTYGRGIWSSATYLSVNNNESENNIASFKTKLKTYPNPTSENTTLSFRLANAGDVELAVYSISGRLVKSIRRNDLASGENTILIDCEDIPNGTYIVKFQSGKQVESVKFIKM